MKLSSCIMLLAVGGLIALGALAVASPAQAAPPTPGGGSLEVVNSEVLSETFHGNVGHFRVRNTVELTGTYEGTLVCDEFQVIRSSGAGHSTGSCAFDGAVHGVTGTATFRTSISLAAGGSFSGRWSARGTSDGLVGLFGSGPFFGAEGVGAYFGFVNFGQRWTPTATSTPTFTPTPAFTFTATPTPTPSPTTTILPIDQTLPGNPACTEANFPAPISSSNAVAVPFVPGQPKLVAVELCLKTTAAGFVGLNVWQGTPANRQILRSSVTLHVPAGVTGFVRFDLPAIIDIAPGQPHFLEIPNSQPFALLSQDGTGATVGFRTWSSTPADTPTATSTHTPTPTSTFTPP